MDELKAMFEPHILYTIHIGKFDFNITPSMVTQWAIMIFVIAACYLLTRNLKKIPGKRQSSLEIFVETVNNLVKENMGEGYASFGPYIGTIMIFLLFMNLIGLIGIEPPTTDYSVALGMGITTFCVIQGYAIWKIGLKHYFIAYGKPIVPLIPINILERVMLPISLSLRLFGNLLAAAVIMKLSYIALGGITPLFGQLLLPIPLHAYFDVFDGTIQMVIFTMLTMVNIKIIAEH